MNQTQLKVFTAAAENRSFTKTAEQLFITQAAVTQHIQALEAAIGCELFDRRKRPMRLTPAGKTFCRPVTRRFLPYGKSSATICFTGMISGGVS